LVDGSLESPCQVLVKYNWTYFSISYGSGATRQKVSRLAAIRRGVGQFQRIFQGEGVVAGEYFFGFYKTRHILLSDSANCTMLRAVVLTQYWRVIDGQTDGIAIVQKTTNLGILIPILRKIGAA